MDSFVSTAWVKPPYQITGLDHLGVQAPCIQIYSDLLPGITNVTYRARYYSFYPWLLTQFEAQGWRSDEQLIPMLRRAECLLTLIGLHHSSIEGGDEHVHEAAMVGVVELRSALQKIHAGEPVRLSDYAHRSDERPGRYFKNPFGALAQYYFGALSGLGLLSGESASKARVLKETGAALAKIVAQTVPGDRFIQALVEDEVDSGLLDELTPFCFCQLQQASEEVEALIGIMLSGWPAIYPEGIATAEELAASKTRSRSLAYLCQLAAAAAEHKVNFDVLIFRGMSYSHCGPTNSSLVIPETFQGCSLDWQAYQRNELLSVALQGLFYAQLRAAELSPRSFANTQTLSRWFWEESLGKDVLQAWPSATAGGFMANLTKELPEFSDWQHEQHEIQCMGRVNRLTDKTSTSPEDVLAVLQNSLVILAAITGRPENALGYGHYNFPDNYLDYYPVNLQTVLADWQQTIGQQSPLEGMALFTRHNCLDTHLRVAMRKLRQQGQNTFRFEPSEIGLVIKEIPHAANTTPRFDRAIRILLDLGLLESEQTWINTSQRGWAFIEAAL